MTRLFLPLIAAALVAGCATAPQATSTAPVAAYRDTIELAGRISVNYQHNGNPESLSGKFDWVQAGQRVDVTLSSPLGQTMAKISVTPDAATLTQTDKQPRTARDIDSLTRETLGWQLPVSGLRDWMQGYATAQDGSRFTASPANTTVTTRDGWRLRYVSWQDGTENSAHPQPKRIDAERSATPTSEELAIRIVIDPPA